MRQKEIFFAVFVIFVAVVVFTYEMNFKLIAFVCVCVCFHAASALGKMAANEEQKETERNNKTKRQLPSDFASGISSLGGLTNQIPLPNVIPSSLANITNQLENQIPSQLPSLNDLPSWLGNISNEIQDQFSNGWPGSLDDLKNQLILLFIEKASSLSFLAVFTNYLAKLDVNLNFVNPNLIDIAVNASQYINISIDNYSLYDNWIYLKKNFMFNVPDDSELLNLTQCFRSDGKQLMWNQYWITPIDAYVYSFNLIDYVQLNANIKYNCLFNYSYVSKNTTFMPIMSSSTISSMTSNSFMTNFSNSTLPSVSTTTVSPVNSSEIVNLQLSLNLTFVTDYANLSSAKSLQLIQNYNSFVSL